MTWSERRIVQMIWGHGACPMRCFCCATVILGELAKFLAALVIRTSFFFAHKVCLRDTFSLFHKLGGAFCIPGIRFCCRAAD